MSQPVKVACERRSGLNTIIDDARMEFLSLDLLVLDSGDSHTIETGEREVAVVPMCGVVDIKIEDIAFTLKRTSVFKQRGSALYIPRDTTAVFSARSFSEVALCKARADTKKAPLYIPPIGTHEKIVGRGNYQRRVVDIVDDCVDAQRLILGETYNEPGAWSSFPPHKHDEQIAGVEARMEEIYLFRLNPADGFGLQRVYTADDSDRPFAVRDYDVVTIPRGYHPVSAMPGYELYYLWFLGGPERKPKWNTDPRYEWIETSRKGR